MSVNVAAPRAAAARNELPFLRHGARPAPTAVRSAPRTVSPVAGPIPVKGHCSARNHRRSRRTGFRAVSACLPSRRLLPTRSVICGWSAPTNWPAGHPSTVLHSRANASAPKNSRNPVIVLWPRQCQPRETRRGRNDQGAVAARPAEVARNTGLLPTWRRLGTPDRAADPVR